jgi:hypothetical protein
MNLIPYKQWVIEEAQRWRVHPNTIQSRVCNGQYPELRRYFTNSKVINVPPWPVAWILRPMGAPVKYDFSKTDWGRTNSAIARKLGCHPGTVRHARMKREIIST